jgi:hypothetical protein
MAFSPEPFFSEEDKNSLETETPSDEERGPTK